MLPLVTVLIAIISVLLIAVILIQNPKGGGIDSTFGGSQANQMFGAARSADFVEKLTWYLAAALLVLCIVAAIMAGAGAESLPTPEVPPTNTPQ
ncbi:MAG: preprotein translocase subunit SecG [Saprospiraceae bacterium]|jgi:preprotein translocase subunit SecG|nr:preprotein translocase subunit SecG [Saprospiraceae bacterium]MBK7795598.1 preprotein translocase subunit SecG [Saprospiraceae bacterium]MBK8154121.1 preprotein translocase subunit SecG [Saprospiraceae bacterium]MBL0260709.1 preprotein translocase subunit SecG [Saprospiraceae bacterium]